MPDLPDLRWPWIALALGVAVLALLLWWARRRTAGPGLLVAHVDRLRALPRYRALARRELAVTAVATTGALLLLAGTALLAARPTRPMLTEPDRNGRDIVLCLDVSASMDRWNLQIVDHFSDLLTELRGERIGLTIFSGSAVAILPLTDDYAYVAERLEEARDAFATDDWDYFTGAEAARRASQTGDGLLSCLERFEEVGDGRGRAVVLATDHDPRGQGIFTLPEAAEEAVRRDVVVYGIGTPNMKPEQSQEYAAAVTTTGGRMSVVDEDGTAEELVDAIQRLERARLRPRPTGIDVDDPQLPFGVAVAGLVVVLGAGLIGRRR